MAQGVGGKWGGAREKRTNLPRPGWPRSRPPCGRFCLALLRFPLLLGVHANRPLVFKELSLYLHWQVYLVQSVNIAKAKRTNCINIIQPVWTYGWILNTPPIKENLGLTFCDCGNLWYIIAPIIAKIVAGTRHTTYIHTLAISKCTSRASGTSINIVDIRYIPS